jgi:hypothetical protein
MTAVGWRGDGLGKDGSAGSLCPSTYIYGREAQNVQEKCRENFETEAGS